MAEQQERDLNKKPDGQYNHLLVVQGKDSIIELKHIVSKEGHATACIRKEGQLDLYWNFKLVDYTDKKAVFQDEESNVRRITKYEGLEMNFDQIKVTQIQEVQYPNAYQEDYRKKTHVMIALD